MASFKVQEPDSTPRDLSAQQPHAENVQLLASHVLRAHVDDTLEPEQGTDSGSRHAMLSRTGFGDDALFAHALDQQCLAEAVVDLVRAGVQQVFTLQIDLCAAQFVRQSLREE